MDEEKLKQIIREEIKKIEKQPYTIDVHLHIHGDGLDSFKLLEALSKHQNYQLKAQVLDAIRKNI